MSSKDNANAEPSADNDASSLIDSENEYHDDEFELDLLYVENKVERDL